MTTRTTAAEALHVTRAYGNVPAVDAVSLRVHEGDFVAVMGPSGSGKSTLMNLLSGLDEPTSGSVSLAGVPLAGLSDDQASDLRRDRMGFVFQSFNLLSSLTAKQNIDLPMTLGSRTHHQDNLAWRAKLLDKLGLTELLDRHPGELSGGQQQRVAIARALAHEPAVVFADEPTGNLDVESGRAVLEILSQLSRERGYAVVMVTHDPTAAAIADRVVFLRNGALVSESEGSTAADIAQIMVGLVR